MRGAGIPTIREWTDIVVVLAVLAPWLFIIGLIIIAVVHDHELKELSNRVRTLEVIQRAVWKSERD